MVLRDSGPKDPLEIGGVKLRVLGPGTAEVEDLKERWQEDVKKILAKEGDRAVLVQSAGGLDGSVFNLSSIVVVAESEAGRTMLLTGDARGDIMLNWMEAAGDVLDEDGKLHVDLLKLPHHGSDRNVSNDFFERITADHYVVSGDGRHGNPEPETFDWLFQARGDADYTIHMTYSPQELKESNDFEHDKLRQVFDRHPGSRDRLRFPDGGESSISVEL